MLSKLVIHLTFQCINQINHKVFSICFLFSFKIFLQLLCTSLVPLISSYSTQILLENAVFCRHYMVGGMVQNSTNQNHHQHQQPICSSTFFFYINNKIRPTSTINIIINHRNMPNSTTRENQHQQKFLFSSTKICLTTNIGHRLQQQNTFNNLGTNDWLWSREVGTQKF